MKTLIHKAINAAIAAGKSILEVYQSESLDVDFKTDKSPLTLADRLSHETIVSGLSETEYPVLSEEGALVPYEQRSSWNVFWLIDPLDGTKEFIKRNGEFTVNIALIENGVPIAGVVYVPVSDDLYFSADDRSYFLQKASQKKDLSESVLITCKMPESKNIKVVASRSHLNDDTTQFIDKLRKNGYECHLESRGSSLKLCQIACGDAHLYPRFAPTMEWDTAAAHAVCRGAGALVLDRSTKKELQYNKENLLNNHFLVFPKEWTEIYNFI